VIDLVAADPVINSESSLPGLTRQSQAAYGKMPGSSPGVT
jgi:hypothetical protein